MFSEDRTEVDVVLVIGGFNSSNTSHLAAMCSRKFPTYHIEGPECLRPGGEVRHRLPPGGADAGAVVVDPDWLPGGPVTVGLTSGASTPDVMVHRSIVRVLGLRGLTELDCRVSAAA